MTGVKGRFAAEWGKEAARGRDTYGFLSLKPKNYRSRSNTLDLTAGKLENAGFTLLCGREEFRTIRFFDIGGPGVVCTGD